MENNWKWYEQQNPQQNAQQSEQPQQSQPNYGQYNYSTNANSGYNAYGAGNGGSGTASVTIDADSKWVVTGDSTLTNLACEGEIVDAAGNAVSVVGTDGAVYVQGDSEYTVTGGNYAETCDLTGAGEITGWDASVMPM